jgi:hypothetical protein
VCWLIWFCNSAADLVLLLMLCLKLSLSTASEAAAAEPHQQQGITLPHVIIDR